MSLEIANILSGSLAGLAAIAAAVCGTEILKLRRRLAGLESRPGIGNAQGTYDAVAARISSLQSSISVLQSGLADVQNTLGEMEERGIDGARALAAAAANGRPVARLESNISTPINLNRRGQLLRMHRRGESIPAIASALGISQGEVKLTVRMQELYSDMPEKENSHDRL